MSKTKGGGSTKNGRDSNAQRLGVKAYDGTDLAVAAADVAVAQITTRDIDRGDSPHFLLKEIQEAPESYGHRAHADN